MLHVAHYMEKTNQSRCTHKMTSLILKEITGKHRGVDTIVATSMMIAITVSGGTIVFAFTQGFFSQAQISGTPNLELVRILGYDARDLSELTVHNGYVMNDGTAGNPISLGKNVDERVAVHINNLSVHEILLTEIRLGGTVYDYDTSIEPLGAWDDTINLAPGKYFILRDSTTIIQEPIPLVQPGQYVTILIDLKDDFSIGRDMQFKLTTASGAVFMSTVVMGKEVIQS